MRRLSYILLFAPTLWGCAPPGHFYETGSFVARPRDACALRETASSFAAALNRKIGDNDGPRERVIAVERLVASGFVEESRTQFASCRGVLVYSSGQSQIGTISVTDRNGADITQVSWQSDESVQKQADQERAQVAENQRRTREREASEKAVLIEPKAVLFDDSAESKKLIEKLVYMVRNNGFACATVSAARPTLMSPGYKLVCNEFRYTYSIQDKGGRWVVSVD